MPMRIGIIGGAGHIGYVVAGLAELEDAVICAVAPGCAEEDIEIVKSRAGGAPDAKAYADYRELLDRERPDIVAVSPFYYLHAEVSCEALKRGTAVYCEKPLALTLEALEQVRRAHEESGAPVGMMLDFRYQPAFHTARKLVEAGAIGTPTVGYSQKSYKRGTRPEFYRKRATFGGIIPWVGIHAIDWFRWVSGQEYVSVCGHHAKLHRPDYPEMEDAATCLFELENGGTAVMSFDFLRPQGAATHGDDRLRVLGEKGAIEARGRDWLELVTEQGAEQVPVEAPERGTFADFALSVLDTDHVCRITSADALRVTEIVLRARDAADRHERIDLRG